MLQFDRHGRRVIFEALCQVAYLIERPYKVKEQKDGAGAPAGTETPAAVVTAAKQWVAEAVHEKAGRTKKDFKARSCKCVTFQMPLGPERDAFIEELKSGGLIPPSAKTYAYVGHIQTDDLGGLMICVATKVDMVSPSELTSQLERLNRMPKDTSPRQKHGSVIDQYRRPRPQGHIVMPDGTIGTRSNIGDGNEMGAELLKLVDEA